MNLNSYKETWGTISVDDPVEESLKKIDALLAAGVDVNLRNNDYEKHEDELFKIMNNKYTMNNLVAMVQEELKNFN